jgi:hypothetical protein
MFYLFEQHIPVIFQGTELLSLVQAVHASFAKLEMIITKEDIFKLDLFTLPEVLLEFLNGHIGCPLGLGSNECSDFFHVSHLLDSNLAAKKMPNYSYMLYSSSCLKKGLSNTLV